MKVGDLFLGEVEGSEEFKSQESIDGLYFMGVTAKDVDDLLSGKKRYIHGQKGTGKTSLIKVLESKCKAENIPYISLSYRKIREDAEIIHEFREKFRLFKDTLSEEEDKDTITLTFWNWYILSLIARDFLQSDPLDLIYSTGQVFFRAIAAVIDMLVVTVDPMGNISLGLNVNKPSAVDENENMSKAAQKIRLLSNKIKDSLDRKVVIFIDELELSKARGTYGIDKVMIKNLLLATRHINNISKNLHIVLAVRDEVLYDLRGDEINKLRDDFGVSLSWWTTSRVTVDHALWRLMFKKIRYSMKGHENPDILNNAELWSRWFPFDVNNKASWKFFFELTWARPRDFVRLLNLMQDNCKNEINFTRQSYDLAVSSYSQRTYNEISEEISTLFDDESMRILEKVIQELGVNFKYDTFVISAQKNRLPNAETVIDEMYRVGLVGNHFYDGVHTKWRFFYRKDQTPDRSQPFEVHRALHDGLGIKNRFSEAVLFGRNG